MDEREREKRLTEVFELLVKRATDIETTTAEKWTKMGYNIVNKGSLSSTSHIEGEQ